MTTADLKREFDALSPTEQVLLVQEFWDRITERPEQVPVPESHIAELNRRLEDHDRNPDDVVTWADVRAKLQSSRS